MQRDSESEDDAHIDRARSICLQVDAADAGAIKRLASAIQAAEHKTAASAGATDTSIARMILDLRRARTHFLAPAMFGEPAWDMLLALFVAGEPLQLEDLAIATNVPLTTAARWVAYLESERLVTRELCLGDQQTQKIWLGDRAREKLSSLSSAFERKIVTTRA